MKRADLLATLDIGAAVKKLREMKGISQEELAKDICDRTNITKLENGYSKIPSLSFVLLICDKLEITIQDFLNFAMSNSYSINKIETLDFLLNKKFIELEKYINTIDPTILSKNDLNYYKYLQSILLISKNNNQKAILLLKEIIANKETNQTIKLLSYHELIKSQYVDLDISLKNKLFSYQNLKTITKEDSPLVGFYLLNQLINKNIDNDKLLELQLEFINNHKSYKFLSYYYENKIKSLKSLIEKNDTQTTLNELETKSHSKKNH